MDIVLSKIKSVDIRDFVENKNYKVTLTPTSLVNFGLFKKKYRPYGHYSITEVGYGGHINHSEEYIYWLGLTIHNDKVCFPPQLIIYYDDGTKDVISYKSYEEADKKRKEITSQLKCVTV